MGIGQDSVVDATFEETTEITYELWTLPSDEASGQPAVTGIGVLAEAIALLDEYGGTSCFEVRDSTGQLISIAHGKSCRIIQPTPRAAMISRSIKTIGMIYLLVTSSITTWLVSMQIADGFAYDLVGESGYQLTSQYGLLVALVLLFGIWLLAGMGKAHREGDKL